MDTIIELLGSGLLGGILGGLFRLLPEVINVFEQRAANKHELEMQKLQMERDKLLHGQQLEKLQAESQVVLDKGGLDALLAGIKAQGQLTGNAFIDAVNMLVRPVVTYWYLALYSAVKIALIFVLLRVDGVGLADALLQAWGPADMSTFVGILNFWFLDRVIRKQQAGA